MYTINISKNIRNKQKMHNNENAKKNITIVYVFTAKFKLIAKHLLKCNKHKYIVFFICQIKKVTFRNRRKC